jgi:hypothetical protein
MRRVYDFTANPKGQRIIFYVKDSGFSNWDKDTAKSGIEEIRHVVESFVDEVERIEFTDE